jgi:hypothetical protein
MSTDPRIAIVADWMRQTAAASVVAGNDLATASAAELLARLDTIDDQVERVARAIHDADYPYGANEPECPWHVEPSGVRETYRRLARAAMAVIA